LVAVNHGIAHIEIGKLVRGCRDPLILYVAGGNTLVAGHVEGRYRILGETLDIAAGNCLDSFGLAMDIGPMPQPELYASRATKVYELPYRVKGMDMSFSGLLTAAERLLANGARLEDVCLSLVETAYSMLVEVMERAIAYTDKREILVVGGLARSRRLVEMLAEMGSDHKAGVHTVPDEYAGDNGAMIAWTGLLYLRAGMTVDVEQSYVRPKARIDEVETGWIS